MKFILAKNYCRVGYKALYVRGIQRFDASKLGVRGGYKVIILCTLTIHCAGLLWSKEWVKKTIIGGGGIYTNVYTCKLSLRGRGALW